MEELKETYIEIRLGDIAYFQKGFAFKSKDFEEVGRKIVKVSNLTDQSIDINSCVCLAEKLAEKYEKYSLNLDDIIITTVGSWPTNPASVVGKVIKVPKKAETALLNQNAVRIRANEKITQKYLYYALKYEKFKNYIINTAQGSASQASITQEDIKNYLINLPPIETQEKIASILSALDDKIEINNEMNKTLEEMAQTLFKRWFIDFDFPNENGEPYRSSGGKMVDSELGEIPEGWEVVSFSELIELFNGYSYKGKELMKSNNAMITIKNFNRNGGFQVEGFKEISISDKVRENHYVNKGDVIVAHTDLTQGAEIIGNSIYIQTFGKYEKIITSMDTVKVKSKNHEISNLLIHMFLNHKKFKEHALGYVNGTTVLHLSKKAIPEYKIAIPINKKNFDNMDKLLKPIYKEQNLKLEEVWELTKLRDTLLPKLMSGEVGV